MKMIGFEKIHHTNLKMGSTYFLRTHFGAGYVIPRESTLDGVNVELQPDASFISPARKKYSAKHIMPVGNGEGTFYEPKS